MIKLAMIAYRSDQHEQLGNGCHAGARRVVFEVPKTK